MSNDLPNFQNNQFSPNNFIENDKNENEKSSREKKSLIKEKVGLNSFNQKKVPKNSELNNEILSSKNIRENPRINIGKEEKVKFNSNEDEIENNNDDKNNDYNSIYEINKFYGNEKNKISLSESLNELDFLNLQKINSNNNNSDNYQNYFPDYNQTDNHAIITVNEYIFNFSEISETKFFIIGENLKKNN